MRLAEVQIQTLLIRRFSPPLTLLIVDFFKLCMHDGHSAYREHGFFSFTLLLLFSSLMSTTIPPLTHSCYSLLPTIPMFNGLSLS